MVRTLAVTILFFSIFSCSSACATASQPKKVEENKVANETANDWVQLPASPEYPTTTFLRNTVTNALVSINFIFNKETVSSAIATYAIKTEDEDTEISDVTISDNGETASFSFKHALPSGQFANGVVTIKRLNPDKPLVVIFGVWPSRFHKEMSSDYKVMVDTISKTMRLAGH